MLILHVGRSQMHATTNIYPPSPTTAFKAVKDTSLLYVFCYSFVPRDTHMHDYLRINKKKKLVHY